MNILARTGNARWCSNCGQSWQHHMGWLTYSTELGRAEARCLNGDWITKRPARRRRRYLALAHRLYVEAVERDK